jgi:hypothetical protein
MVGKVLSDGVIALIDSDDTTGISSSPYVGIDE